MRPPMEKPRTSRNMSTAARATGRAKILIQCRYRPSPWSLALSMSRPQMGSLTASQIRAMMVMIMTFSTLISSTSV